jgi:hypothetical protein
MCSKSNDLSEFMASGAIIGCALMAWFAVSELLRVHRQRIAQTCTIF